MSVSGSVSPASWAARHQEAGEHGWSHAQGNASHFRLYILLPLLEGIPSLLCSLTEARGEAIPLSPRPCPVPGMLTGDRLLQANASWHCLWAGGRGPSPARFSTSRPFLPSVFRSHLSLSFRLFPARCHFVPRIAEVEGSSHGRMNGGEASREDTGANILEKDPPPKITPGPRWAPR